MLCLHVQAPFAVFRTFSTGSFRPTASFMTPSAAYGLLLNLAGIEMRHDDKKSVMTLIKSNLPAVRLALGAVVFPQEHSLFQQLHNYPVGKEAGKDHKPLTKGNKYNIVPVRRAFLSELNAYICFESSPELEQKVLDGLEGKHPRYGLPFLGDNNFLPDKLEIIAERQPVHWYQMLDADAEPEMENRVTRLTLSIDRADMAKTRSQLFVPLKRPQIDVPEQAWVEVCYG